MWENQLTIWSKSMTGYYAAMLYDACDYMSCEVYDKALALYVVISIYLPSTCRYSDNYLGLV